jgi:hypothetical protein
MAEAGSTYRSYSYQNATMEVNPSERREQHEGRVPLQRMDDSQCAADRGAVVFAAASVRTSTSGTAPRIEPFLSLVDHSVVALPVVGLLRSV